MATNISLKTASSSKVERVQPALVAAHPGVPIRRSTRNASKKRNASDSNPVEKVKRVKQHKDGARGESSKVDDEVDDEGDDEWGEGDEGESSSGDSDYKKVVNEEAYDSDEADEADDSD